MGLVFARSLGLPWSPHIVESGEGGVGSLCFDALNDSTKCQGDFGIVCPKCLVPVRPACHPVKCHRCRQFLDCCKNSEVLRQTDDEGDRHVPGSIRASEMEAYRHGSSFGARDHQYEVLEQVCSKRFRDNLLLELVVDNFRKRVTPGTNLDALRRLLALELSGPSQPGVVSSSLWPSGRSLYHKGPPRWEEELAGLVNRQASRAQQCPAADQGRCRGTRFRLQFFFKRDDGLA